MIDIRNKILLLSCASFVQFLGHHSQSLLIQVEDEFDTDKLHNSANQIHDGNQIAHLGSDLDALRDKCKDAASKVEVY